MNDAAGCRSDQSQQAKQPAKAQQQEADYHAIHQAEAWLLRVVRWNHGCFDVIAAIPIHRVNDRTHAWLAAHCGPRRRPPAGEAAPGRPRAPESKELTVRTERRHRSDPATPLSAKPERRPPRPFPLPREGGEGAEGRRKGEVGGTASLWCLPCGSLPHGSHTVKTPGRDQGHTGPAGSGGSGSGDLVRPSGSGVLVEGRHRIRLRPFAGLTSGRPRPRLAPLYEDPGM